MFALGFGWSANALARRCSTVRLIANWLAAPHSTCQGLGFEALTGGATDSFHATFHKRRDLSMDISLLYNPNYIAEKGCDDLSSDLVRATCALHSAMLLILEDKPLWRLCLKGCKARPPIEQHPKAISLRSKGRDRIAS
jgi:hypothetical protein